MVPELLKLMNHPHTLEDLAKHLDSSPSAIKHTLHLLEKQGYVESGRLSSHDCHGGSCCEDHCSNCAYRATCSHKCGEATECKVPCPIVVWKVTAKGQEAAERG